MLVEWINKSMSEWMAVIASMEPRVLRNVMQLIRVWWTIQDNFSSAALPDLEHGVAPLGPPGPCSRCSLDVHHYYVGSQASSWGSLGCGGGGAGNERKWRREFIRLLCHLSALTLNSSQLLFHHFLLCALYSSTRGTFWLPRHNNLTEHLGSAYTLVTPPVPSILDLI